MVGKIFITSHGYDPEYGEHIKDPFLDGEPSLGACRPDIRETLQPGDHIFTISGGLPRVQQINQYVFCGFEIKEKIAAIEAFERFPQRRLRKNEFGQLVGNIIVDQYGCKHPLDQHRGGSSFERRKKNYVIGKNLIMPNTPAEIAMAREQTMDILCRVIGKLGNKPFDLIGRSGKKLNEKQVAILIEWLLSLKVENSNAA